MIAADWARMGEEAKACVAAGAEILHLDVMDGQFVHNLTMGPDMVGAIKKAVPSAILDVHLMIYSPEDYIEAFVKNGAQEIIFHLEATEEVEYTIDYIHRCNCKAGLAIKPETSETLVFPYLEKLDKVLVMTVDPGFGGQAFMPEMLEKVELLRKHTEIDIQVDGGVDFETGKQCVLKGATRLVSGTFLFKQKDRKAAIAKFHQYRTIVQ